MLGGAGAAASAAAAARSPPSTGICRAPAPDRRASPAALYLARSFARWRELPVALLGLCFYGGGLGCQHALVYLDVRHATVAEAGGVLGLLRQAALLAFASAAVAMCAVALSLRARFRRASVWVAWAQRSGRRG